MFDQLVKLEPVSHTYTDGVGNKYLSVSALLSMLSEPFQKDMIAGFVAKKRGVSKETVIAEWDKKRNDAAVHGTRIHNALELYSDFKQVKDEDLELKDAITSIIHEYSRYKECKNEVCLYSKRYRVAGTTDKICILSGRKDCDVDIADFKTNLSKPIQYFSEYKKNLFAPLDHLQDCNFIKYSLQLSLYAYMFEELTGRRVRQLFIHMIPPPDVREDGSLDFSPLLQHRRIPVYYAKTDVKLLLDRYEGDILNKVNEVSFITEL
jgi:hypothetical protein